MKDKETLESQFLRLAIASDRIINVELAKAAEAFIAKLPTPELALEMRERFHEKLIKALTDEYERQSGLAFTMLAHIVLHSYVQRNHKSKNPFSDNDLPRMLQRLRDQLEGDQS